MNKDYNLGWMDGYNKAIDDLHVVCINELCRMEIKYPPQFEDRRYEKIEIEKYIRKQKMKLIVLQNNICSEEIELLKFEEQFKNNPTDLS